MESDYVCLHPSLVLSPASPSFIISLWPSVALPRQFLQSLCPHFTLSESYFYARQLPTGYILQPAPLLFCPHLVVFPLHDLSFSHPLDFSIVFIYRSRSLCLSITKPKTYWPYVCCIGLFHRFVTFWVFSLNLLQCFVLTFPLSLTLGPFP